MSLFAVLLASWVIGIPLLVAGISVASRAYFRHARARHQEHVRVALYAVPDPAPARAEAQPVLAADVLSRR